MSEIPQAPERATSTPLPIIALVSRIVTAVADRLTGDRSDSPLLVATACAEALKSLGIRAEVMYGPAAWIEVMDDHSVIWAGCWGENFSFWVATEFGEVVDLNTSVATRKRAHDRPEARPLYSPPMLWSREVPAFYRYKPEGVAELELTDVRDKDRYEKVLREVRSKCVPTAPELVGDEEPQFPNEPILCPGRKLLDDSHGTFRHFDRALAVQGIPACPLD